MSEWAIVAAVIVVLVLLALGSHRGPSLAEVEEYEWADLAKKQAKRRNDLEG